MTGLVNMAQQFQGLPMGDLIGAPLGAACDAQVKLAQATADFIKTVGFQQSEDGSTEETRTAAFRFTRPVINADGTTGEEEVSMEVPLLSIVKVPNLGVSTVDITFDMEVKSSFSQQESKDNKMEYDVETGLKIGPFSMNARIAGSVSSHMQNTRSSDNSAKYHVNVKAEDKGMPEGLARVMDIMQTACEPRVRPLPQPETVV
ncbi:DUF2589 domain-containing protein [Luteibacter yeojuensis]|uniref:DUF2589 domain-containing protein n=1 Tax=Luteibacter yeojuensis TaxID=345309 RepID=A0A7X5TQH6_9GAMM|nr:DUF2589 domain-containing protein [Luteibacter yeojuensis]NID16100.1 DUF2589 domain-containing protein [Luteibacter yeojuensis]